MIRSKLIQARPIRSRPVSRLSMAIAASASALAAFFFVLDDGTSFVLDDGNSLVL